MDYWFDALAMCLYTAHLLYFSFITKKSFRQEDFRNLYNLTISSSAAFFMFIRILALFYSIFYDHNKDYSKISTENYLMFQLPFDLLNIAVLA